VLHLKLEPKEGPRPATVELARAEIRTLRRTVEAVGTTRAVKSVDMSPKWMAGWWR